MPVSHLELQKAAARRAIAKVPGDRGPKPAVAGANGFSKRVPDLELSTPQSFVHCMLFIIEYAASTNPRRETDRRHLHLFFSRVGGLHLLLMLLNAHYNKPLAGRDPGWVFRGIRDRIQISERALRMLINDAVAEGLIIQLHGTRDRRCRKYRLTPPVVAAWEALTETLRISLSDVFDQFDPGALANVDYRSWDPNLPAHDQIEALPPSRRHLRHI